MELCRSYIKYTRYVRLLIGLHLSSYEMSLAVWDHTVLPATWHKCKTYGTIRLRLQTSSPLIIDDTRWAAGLSQQQQQPDTSEHMQRGWYSIYLPHRDGRLSWSRWPVIYQDGLPTHRWSPIQVQQRLSYYCPGICPSIPARFSETLLDLLQSMQQQQSIHRASTVRRLLTVLSADPNCAVTPLLLIPSPLYYCYVWFHSQGITAMFDPITAVNPHIPWYSRNPHYRAALYWTHNPLIASTTS